jgi:hypothetical protein
VIKQVGLDIKENIPLVEEILDRYKGDLGTDRPGYRNHVYRMIHFSLAQGAFSDDEKQKIVVAGCFHDLGIWTAGTFDYLPPSIELAAKYLCEVGLDGWVRQVTLMIDEHHKISAFGDDRLAEAFRRGDLVDFSLGLFKCGVPASYVKEVKRRFPNAGFHKYLVKLAGRWIFRHPLHPVPVLKL